MKRYVLAFICVLSITIYVIVLLGPTGHVSDKLPVARQQFREDYKNNENPSVQSRKIKISPGKTTRANHTTAMQRLADAKCRSFATRVKDNRPKMKFVFFFGFNHCGSSATGMVLDAHPHAIVANEFDLFGDMLMGNGLDSLLRHLCYSSELKARKMDKKPMDRKGYSLKMGESHGLCDGDLKLIGIRKSLVTLTHFMDNQERFYRSFRRLARIFVMSGILVTRNVYDMIATRLSVETHDILFKASLINGSTVYVSKHNISSIGYHGDFYKFCHIGLANGTVKIVPNQEIFDVIEYLGQIANSSNNLIQFLNIPRMVIKLDEMIADPRATVLQMCSFFDLECFPSYMDQVVGGLFSEANPTRRGIEWTQEYIQAVEELKQNFPEYFFGSYWVQ